MRLAAFISRNRKELLRDPFSLIFGIGLPLFLLMIISSMQNSIKVDIFKIELFAPGIAMFSFSFISMFSGMLIAKDRSSSFLTRLFASPLTASDYIIGYSLPLLPIALLQSVICFGTAFFLGLPVNANILMALLVFIPIAILFIGLGLLLGSILSDKQVGGIMSILIQVVAFTSGMWFNLDLIGGAFKTIGYALPFAHALDAARAALSGDLAPILPHLLWVIGYAVVIFLAAIWIFKKKMKN
ncbi:MAG: ABC transporter permease [Clostridiaceae bacterium]|nr:ABC transporter permease [Clostridiaceae bacterium]